MSTFTYKILKNFSLTVPLLTADKGGIHRPSFSCPAGEKRASKIVCNFLTIGSKNIAKCLETQSCNYTNQTFHKTGGDVDE